MFSMVPITDTNAKLYTWKESLLLQRYITGFHQKFCITAIQYWYFICHMCTSWAPITVAKNIVRNLSDEQNFTKFCVGVIMKNGWYLFLLTKSNHNNMVAIDRCLFKLLRQITLVLSNSQVYFYNKAVCQLIMCFILLMTANRILPLYTHTINTSLNCCKIEYFVLLI